MRLAQSQVHEIYQMYCEQVHGQMRQDLADDGCALAEAWAYALAARGKMLRALILLEACSAVGGNPAQMIPAAAGIEYGHLASLVHDDIIDKADLRRGQESVVKRYGLDRALLLGDLLIFQSFLSLAQCGDNGVSAERIVAALNVISRCCADLCLGQDLEMAPTGMLPRPSEAYTKMIRLKTGALFRAAAECGAILGGGTLPQVVAAAHFGEELGMCFQIVDDLLPYISTETELGKPVINDIANKRVTLPILIAAERATDAQLNVLNGVFFNSTIEGTADTYRTVLEIMHATDSLADALMMVHTHVLIARRHLHTLRPSVSRDNLETILTLATERKS